jgi:hypothetical protein
MALPEEVKQTFEGFEGAVRVLQSLVDRMDRVPADYPSADVYFDRLRENAVAVLEEGQKVALLMEGIIDEDRIAEFRLALNYQAQTADRPTMARKERLDRLQEIKNLYLAAKPIMISTYSEE